MLGIVRTAPIWYQTQPILGLFPQGQSCLLKVLAPFPPLLLSSSEHRVPVTTDTLRGCRADSGRGVVGLDLSLLDFQMPKPVSGTKEQWQPAFTARDYDHFRKDLKSSQGHPQGKKRPDLWP